MYRAVVLAAAAHVVMMVTDVNSQLLSAVTMDRSPLLLSVWMEERVMAQLEMLLSAYALHAGLDNSVKYVSTPELKSDPLTYCKFFTVLTLSSTPYVWQRHDASGMWVFIRGN